MIVFLQCVEKLRDCVFNTTRTHNHGSVRTTHFSRYHDRHTVQCAYTVQQHLNLAIKTEDTGATEVPLIEHSSAAVTSTVTHVVDCSSFERH